jgi:hypothetical protein
VRRNIVKPCCQHDVAAELGADEDAELAPERVDEVVGRGQRRKLGLGAPEAEAAARFRGRGRRCKVDLRGEAAAAGGVLLLLERVAAREPKLGCGGT